jgi:AcrR family transcriptional regulator
MSRNKRSNLQELARQKQQTKRRRQVDARIRRTRARLGSALVTLIHEKAFNDVTVHELLDRASVGRSTFYLHFRNKNDLLLSQLETFLDTMSTTLSNRKEESHRVLPVAEMFSHIGGQKLVPTSPVRSCCGIGCARWCRAGPATPIDARDAITL